MNKFPDPDMSEPPLYNYITYIINYKHIYIEIRATQGLYVGNKPLKYQLLCKSSPTSQALVRLRFSPNVGATFFAEALLHGFHSHGGTP